MSLSESERRRWTELEIELSRERRLVALNRRLGGMPSRRIILGWAIGGTLGLAIALSGGLVHSAAILTAGVAILAATQVLNGIALIATGVSDIRRHR